MSTQTATGQNFPTPCKRCGGALYRRVDACPYCGAAHPFEQDDPHRRTGMPGSRASATHKPLPRFDELDAPDKPAFAAHAMASEPPLSNEPLRQTALVSTEATIASDEDTLYAPRNTTLTIWRVLCVVGAVVAIGLAYVAYTLFSDGSDSEDRGGEQITQDAQTTTGMIVPSPPAVAQAQTAHATAALKPATPAVPEVAAKPAPVVPAAPAVPAVPATPAATPPMAETPARPGPQFHDAEQALQVARNAFRANDLSSAQAALAAVQTLQPGNSDAQGLSDQMRPLIQRRDTALQAAQACVAQQSWPCARQHANEALAIDSGNDAAKVILERVIRETGWAPLPPPRAATTDGSQAPGELAATSVGVGVVRIATPGAN